MRASAQDGPDLAVSGAARPAAGAAGAFELLHEATQVLAPQAQSVDQSVACAAAMVPAQVAALPNLEPPLAQDDRTTVTTVSCSSISTGASDLPPHTYNELTEIKAALERRLAEYSEVA